MLDRYVYGEAERISPEAPVPVLRVREESEMLGGALRRRVGDAILR
jgi:D-beta-D-heptose 7-phosphate kinase/D-beta-D-heptose 1-phosphate adenosyltransferase